MSKVAFLTTIFPMKQQFLLDFFNSLEKQTYRKFDIIVVNDGYEKFDEIVAMFSSLNIVELICRGSAAENRGYGIKYVLECSYNQLIFGDSDDYFSSNRVEKSLSLLKHNDIVVNDLSLFNEDGFQSICYISKRIINSTVIDIDFIKDKNIFGLSNTAVNVEILQGISFDRELIAVDWYLFSVLLLQLNRAIFNNEAITFYRQHSANCIGLGVVTEQSIRRSIDIKEKNYKVLCNVDLSYEPLYKEIVDLKKKMKKIASIAHFLKKNIDSPFWWEETKLLKEL